MQGLDEKGVSKLLEAIRYASEQHRDQRRKGAEASPYINHPIEVAETVWRVGGVRDVDVVVAAVLHDTIEDTETTGEEIERRFGAAVRRIVEEVTDDKNLPTGLRKQLQVDHARHKSVEARQVKLADKISNLRSIRESPPEDWSEARKREYLEWADRVVAGLRGANALLEAEYDRVAGELRVHLKA